MSETPTEVDKTKLLHTQPTWLSKGHSQCSSSKQELCFQTLLTGSKKAAAVLQQPGPSASPVPAAPHIPALCPPLCPHIVSPIVSPTVSPHRVPICTAPPARLSPHCLCEQCTARERLVIPTLTVSQQAKGIQENDFLRVNDCEKLL